MDYETIKNEFIELKKEELNYIYYISRTSLSKKLSDHEKLEMYRKLKDFEIRLNEVSQRLRKSAFQDKRIRMLDFNDVIIDFEIDRNYLSTLNYDREYVLELLRINPETFRFEMNIHDLRRSKYETLPIDNVLINQSIVDKPVYLYCGCYDEECFDGGGYLTYLCDDLSNNRNEKIGVREKDKDKFEKGKMVIHKREYVNSYEANRIFDEELLNPQNNSIYDCVVSTNRRTEELNHVRTPEYKEQALLERINKLYEKVKGKQINKEILYSGKFLSLLCETYELPNDKVVKKEKVNKNGGKNAVIIIAVTNNEEFIITFQNRINDKIIAEFPAGYIEEGESPIEAAKRELEEETGYSTDDIVMLDEVYTSPGIDNSITYILIANDCVKTTEQKTDGTELVNYGLFNSRELDYFINNNIMCGSANKLAYYNLVVNTEKINYAQNNKVHTRVHRKLKEKTNPLDSKIKNLNY